MSTNGTYRAFAMEYGTFVGILWAMIFLSYVYGVRTMNFFLILLCIGLLIVGFFLPLVFGIRINLIYYRVKDKLSYFQGLFFAFNMFIFACLMNGFFVFGYFEFFDEGMFRAAIIKMFEDANLMETYKQLGMSESYGEMMSLLDEVNNLSSFEKAMIIFNNNFFYGCIMSFIVAYFASRNSIFRKMKNSIS